MNTVEITGPPSISGNVGDPGDPWYIWTFSVVVNGQAGVVSVGSNTNDPFDTPIIEEGLIEDLEQDASDLQGISENDPGTDEDRGDFPDDDDDTAVASNDGDDSTDSA